MAVMSGWELYRYLLVRGGVPGVGGAVAWFAFGVSRGLIKKGNYIRKAVVEVVGGGLMGTFAGPVIASIFAGETAYVFVSFALGAGWSVVIQHIRNSVTAAVESYLRSHGDKKDDA